MTIPGFAAEASIYRSAKVYFGYSRAGKIRSDVMAASVCTDVCDLAKDECEALCEESAVCIAGCFGAAEICKSFCDDGSGGSGGRGVKTRCGCGTNKYCCGKCVHQPGGIVGCDGDCIPLSEKCVPG
jgi:hypothetical protein